MHMVRRAFVFTCKGKKASKMYLGSMRLCVFAGDKYLAKFFARRCMKIC